MLATNLRAPPTVLSTHSPLGPRAPSRVAVARRSAAASHMSRRAVARPALILPRRAPATRPRARLTALLFHSRSRGRRAPSRAAAVIHRAVVSTFSRHLAASLARTRLRQSRAISMRAQLTVSFRLSAVGLRALLHVVVASKSARVRLHIQRMAVSLARTAKSCARATLRAVQLIALRPPGPLGPHAPNHVVAVARRALASWLRQSSTVARRAISQRRRCATRTHALCTVL